MEFDPNENNNTESLSEETPMQELDMFGESKGELHTLAEKEPAKAKKPAMRKPLRIVIVAAGVLLVLAVSVFVRLMVLGGGKIKNVLCVLDGMHISCLAGHDYAEADCLHPMTCKVCGATTGGLGDHNWSEATCLVHSTCTVCKETTGELADHVWSEATCTEPKTCTVCKITEGEPLGHTVSVGICERCKEEIGRDIVDTIIAAIEAIKDNDTEAVNLINDGAKSGSIGTAFGNFNMAKITYFQKDVELYETAIAACAELEELSEVKQALCEARDLLPLGDFSGTVISLQNYLNGVSAYADKINALDAYPELLDALFIQE